MSEPAAIPVYQETLTGAAVDGAQISAEVALALVETDQRIPPHQRVAIMSCLHEARGWLHEARALMPGVETSSIHVVGGSTGGLILP